MANIDEAEIQNNRIVIINLNKQLVQKIGVLISMHSKLASKLKSQADQQYMSLFEKYQQIMGDVHNKIEECLYLVAKQKKDLTTFCQNKQIERREQISLNQQQQHDKMTAIEDVLRMQKMYSFIGKLIKQKQVNQSLFIEIRALIKHCGKFRELS